MTSRRARGTDSIRERPFHAWLAAHLPAGRTGLLPLGDDAAALVPPPGRVAVISTDTLVEGMHFLSTSTPERVGAAAAAVSLSDVAAKGARPSAILLGLIVPRRTPRRWVERVVRGAERMGARYGAHVVGGDTKPGPARAIASTVVGWGDPRHLAPRSGGRPGDLVATTGAVGRGGLAAAALASGGARARRAADDLLEIRPRVREGIALAPFAHALLDTSDGIADSARLLAGASRAAVVLEEDRLPLVRGLRSAARTRAARRRLAFYGGDYELLVALPRGRWARAVRSVRSAGGRLTRVGRIERGGGAWLERDGRREPLPSAGWQPFGPDTGAEAGTPAKFVR
jgi:thiamine-monophosphate kinase